jgi:NDP-sugar pyrophosphorylase family protein
MPDFLMSLVESGDSVLCRVVDDLWMDLGRVEDLAAANDLIAQNRL